MTAHPPEEGRPLLRVVRGQPDAEELAALTAVVLAVSRTGTPAAAPRRSTWADRTALTRRLPHPGPGAWRASALPS